MRRNNGFTMIELMVVIAIAGALVAIAAPSFTGLLAKKRLEGVFAELVTDLQFARSEAVQRNKKVRITFGTGCYVIHTDGVTNTSCTQTGGATLGTDINGNSVDEIKTVRLETSSMISFNPNNTLTYLMFDSVRGIATWDGTSTASGSINLTSTSRPWVLRVSTNIVGRVQTCSPDGSISGYSSTSC